MPVYSRTPSGLILAEHSVDETQVSRALRAHDDALRLIREVDPEHHRFVWKVYRYMGPDRDAVFVTGWWHDDLTPRPLSMALVDKVKRQDLNSRAPRVSADEHNARLRETRRRDAEAQEQAVTDEYAPYLDRGRVSVGHMNRKPSYMRNLHLPKAAR